MKVLKFGGTSIGTAVQLKKVAKIIQSDDQKIVVLSALSGVTDLLSEFIKCCGNQDLITARQIIISVEERHRSIVLKTLSDKNFRQIALGKLNDSIVLLNKKLRTKFYHNDHAQILAQGELLSAMIFYLFFLENNVDLALIPALNFIKINDQGEPNFDWIKRRLNYELAKHHDCKIFLTNGYICKNHKNEIDNLGRGASDYTATIIGNVLNANEIEIWTDIDGLRNNDPRFVDKTQAIRNLSYDEACELAYFGAKILHPSSITPAQIKNIPIIIKNSFNSIDKGTIISDYTIDKGLKAVAAKDFITVIKIKSGRMMQAYGFLKRIFEIFEIHQTSVDMLTTSEISVAMTIDNSKFLNKIKADLEKLGEIEIIENQSIICVVGNYHENQNQLIHKIIEGLDLIPIQMISFGSSKINVAFVIHSDHKAEALNALNNYILNKELCSIHT